MKNYLILILALATASCGQKTESKESNTRVEVDEKGELSMLEAYMDLKDAFVKTNTSEASMAADTFAKSAYARINKDMLAALKTIANNQDIVTQRAAFQTVTTSMIEYVKTNKSDESVYVQYCPMALGNTGASWLSLSNEIRNPYFGDKMLKCGKVTEKL